MNAGAVMLTDLIYWCLIFPFLTIEDYALNFVSSVSLCSSGYCFQDLSCMTVNMHTLNVILLLGDTALNSLVK
ncbi:hypothetical protein Golob_005452, partial [Gossypium lobatum]|nr:hypothetical protein [Gossypium lobatum]